MAGRVRGRMVYVPGDVLSVLGEVKRSGELVSDSEAFRRMARLAEKQSESLYIKDSNNVGMVGRRKVKGLFGGGL